MLLIEGKRAFRKSAGNLDAFDCCMRAMWHFSQLLPEQHGQAIALLRQAIKLDPNSRKPTWPSDERWPAGSFTAGATI